MNKTDFNTEIRDITVSTKPLGGKQYELGYGAKEDGILKACLGSCILESPIEPIKIRIIHYDKQCRKKNVMVDRDSYKPLILIQESGLMGQGYFNNGDDNNSEILPIIHFCEKDLLDKNESYQLRYRNILDNSIWNYFCLNNDTKRLGEILSDISKNYKLGLYKLSVAHEYADFNYRLTRENFFDADAHGSFVVPFPFHSEKAMRDNIAKKESQSQIQKILGYKWRLLLLDDKIGKDRDGNVLPHGKLTNIDKSQSNETKLSIVSERIRELFGDKADIHITAVHNIAHAKEELEHHKYDIVLLDYLLDNADRRSKGIKEEREYSYHLLNAIHEDKLEEKKAREEDRTYTTLFQYGPHKRMYFMFISAFATAVNDRLRAEGLQKNEEYWYIADGACPINTPYLFKNNLLHIMYKRLHDSGIEKLNIKEIVNTLETVFKRGGDVRKSANDNFGKVLTLLYHYKSLLQDIVEPKVDDVKNMEGSVLVTSFMHKHPHHGALLEHIIQLVYLTAFGTIRQWPEMWNEYHYIRSILEVEIENKYDNYSSDEKTEMRGTLKNIELYIYNLKIGN